MKPNEQKIEGWESELNDYCDRKNLMSEDKIYLKSLIGFEVAQARKEAREEGFKDGYIEAKGEYNNKSFQEIQRKTIKEIRRIPLVFRYGEVDRAIESYAKEHNIDLNEGKE